MNFTMHMPPMELTKEEYFEVTEQLGTLCIDVLKQYFNIDIPISLIISQTPNTTHKGYIYGEMTAYHGYNRPTTYVITIYPPKLLRDCYTLNVLASQVNILISTILHEVRHIVQQVQNMFPGSNSIIARDMLGYNHNIPFEVYYQYPWEIDARKFAEEFPKLSAFEPIQNLKIKLLADLSKAHTPNIEFEKGQNLFTYSVNDLRYFAG